MNSLTFLFFRLLIVYSILKHFFLSLINSILPFSQAYTIFCQAGTRNIRKIFLLLEASLNWLEYVYSRSSTEVLKLFDWDLKMCVCHHHRTVKPRLIWHVKLENPAQFNREPFPTKSNVRFLIEKQYEIDSISTWFSNLACQVKRGFTVDYTQNTGVGVSVAHSKISAWCFTLYGICIDRKKSMYFSYGHHDDTSLSRGGTYLSV